MTLYGPYWCDECGEELPLEERWSPDGQITTVTGRCTNPDCEKRIV